MTNREEFRDLLYGTFYESISDSAIIRQQHEKIRTWVQNNIPSRLYRYRAVNEHTFDALRKDEIWGSSIFSFNDPFECMPHYDPERAKELLKREIFSLPPCVQDPDGQQRVMHLAALQMDVAACFIAGGVARHRALQRRHQ